MGVKEMGTVGKLGGCFVANFLPDNLAGIFNAKKYNTAGVIEHTAQCFHPSVKLTCRFFELNVNTFMVFGQMAKSIIIKSVVL